MHPGGQRPRSSAGGGDSAPAGREENIIRYYDVCWSERIRNGHNPESLAIHFGYYRSGCESAEQAKLELNRVLAENLGIGERPFDLLDAGCGVGGTAIDMARRFPQLTAVGVNLSAGQVALAGHFASRAGVAERVLFRRANYLTTGLPDASFDGVACVESLCHCPDRMRFLGEAKRVLRPGGRLCVIDFFRTSLPLDCEEAATYQEVLHAFVLSDYYETPLPILGRAAGFESLWMLDISEAVRAGIERSAHHARERLRAMGEAKDTLMAGHCRGCLGLSRLVERGVLAYGVWVSERR